MHIETTNYGHRWNSRKAATMHTSDSTARPSSWSSNSMNSRGNRKSLVIHPQIVHSSSIPPTHSHVQHHTNQFNSPAGAYSMDPMRTAEQSRFVVGDDFGRRCYTGPYDTTNITDSSYSHNLPMSFQDHDHSFFYRPTLDPNGPDPLPPQIVLKLKERFEKRVLHHNNNRPRSTSNRHFRSPSEDTKSTGNRTGCKSSVGHAKSDKYQLVAAFLVNKGIVEAWHNYAPLPVDVGHSSDDCIGTRMVELTQRRMRLIQRYYSGARQYVVLYVNSSYAEHYLPMGLAHDANTDDKGPRKETKQRKSSHPDIFHTGQRLVSRILSTVLKPQKRSCSVQEMSNSNGEKRRVSPNVESVDSAQSEIQLSEPNMKYLRRNRSLPSYSRSQQGDHSAEIGTSNPTSSLPSRSVSQTHGSRFFRRLFEHIWSSYSRQNSSKSVNFVTHRKASSTGKTGPEGTGSMGAVSSVSQKSDRPKTRDYQNEKESSSSGLIDFSSSTGSTISDHLVFSQPDVLVMPTKGEQQIEADSSDQVNQHSQIWLPKQS